ncbi:MAG: type II secretion system minor pseudopilin GspH [Vibrionaceae bacterium]
MKRKLQSGFTLLEILLVIVLLSMTAVMVVPTLPQASNDEAKQEAERFYQLIQLWNEQALLLSKTMGVQVDKNRYRLLELVGNNWQEVEKKRGTATKVEIPSSVGLDLEMTAMPIEDQLFSKESIFDEMFVEKKTEEEEKIIPPPQIVLMGSGEILPFSLTFLAEGKALWEVTGNDIGSFELKSTDEDRL